MAELQIIGSGVSNYVRSCRMLCFAKGVEPSHLPERPHSASVLGIHPYGLIPVMRHGSFELFESKAIMSYIDRLFPGPKFMPEDAKAMALTEQWIAFTNHKIDRVMMRECVVPFRFHDKAKGPDMARITAALPEIDKQARYLDAALAKTGYLVGGDLTMADMTVLPMVYYTRMAEPSRAIIESCSNLVAYIDRLSRLPSFEATGAPKPA